MGPDTFSVTHKATKLGGVVARAKKSSRFCKQARFCLPSRDQQMVAASPKPIIKSRTIGQVTSIGINDFTFRCPERWATNQLRRDPSFWKQPSKA